MITFLNNYFSGACRRYKKFIRNPRSSLRFAPHLLMLAGAAFAGHSHALSCSASADSWGGGYVLNVTVTNDSSASIGSWQVNLTHNANPGITGSWNANVSSSGNQVEASNVSWNGTLSPGQSTSFGYQGTHSGNFQLPECIGDGGGSPTPTPTNAPTPTPSVTPTSITPTTPPTPTPEPTATPEPGANLIIQENDSGFCSVEGSIDNNNSGFTGSGFANTDNASGTGIEWSLEASTSGNYDLQWRFANGSTTNRFASVIIDGTEQAAADFAGTGAWTSWQDSAVVTVYLSAGIHTVRLNATTSGGLANIDKITVIGGGIKAGNCSGAPTPSPTTPVSPTPTPEPTPTNVPTPTPEPGKALPLHFHETQSWATNITSGLDGRVIKVTNLNRTGSGSLGEAIAASGKRLVVFEVGGVINLQGNRLNIGNGDLYVAGETAPYPGITIIRGQTNVSGNNIVLSHLSFRLGDGDGGASDTMGISGDNIVLNHVAASWSIDECVSMSGANNVTLYKTMVTEALSYSTHGEGEHSKGSLIQRSTNNTALYHTLYAHNALRNPRLHSSAKVALINGVIYNWLPGNDDEGEKKFHYIVHMNDAAMSVVGNVALQGPDSVGDTLVSGHKTGSGDAYMRNNIIVDPFGNALKEYNTSNITPLSQPPLWPQGVVVQPADEAFYEVLRTVGPRPGDRDPINARVVATVANGTGKRVNSQNDVGGYPNYALTRHTVNVPNGLAARRAWLDGIEDSFAVDRSLDLSRLYSIVGSSNSDKLR